MIICPVRIVESFSSGLRRLLDVVRGLEKVTRDSADIAEKEGMAS